jgi:hypothetical protein
VLSLAREHDAHCVIGDPASGLQFWKLQGAVDRTSGQATPPGVNCTAYDPAALTVTPADGEWHLVASQDVLLGTTATGEDAARALLVARHADRLCLVGDPARPLTSYWVDSAR